MSEIEELIRFILKKKEEFKRKKKLYYIGDVREIDVKFAKHLFKIRNRKSLWQSDWHMR